MAGKISSNEKTNDPIGNRTRDLPACSTVPQPTTLLLAPSHFFDARGTCSSHLVLEEYIGKKMRQSIRVCLVF
jgi:hypothetical protein